MRAAPAPATRAPRAVDRAISPVASEETASQKRKAGDKGWESGDGERQWDVINPYTDRAHRAHLIDGLRKAGWSG